MKIFSIFIFAFSLISCSRQKTATIYLAHCDSLFYAEGVNFDAPKMIRGKFNDSDFIKKLFGNMSPGTHKILFKPYSDLCSGDGIGPLIINWRAFLKERGFDNGVLFTDSIEDSYFDDISLKKFVIDGSTLTPPPPPPPPESIVVSTPTSVSSTIPPGTAVLFFWLTKDDKLYYKYDSTHDDKNFIQIKPITVKKIQQVISELERKNGITFNENNLLIKGDGSSLYPVFKKLKEALKQKEIFKFRIVTSTE